MDINKLTIKAQEALSDAQNIAVTRGHQEVDVEHMALALLRQEDGLVPRIVERMGVRPAAVADALEQTLDKRPSVRGPGMEGQSIRISQRLGKSLALAEELAKRLQRRIRQRRAHFSPNLSAPPPRGAWATCAVNSAWIRKSS